MRAGTWATVIAILIIIAIGWWAIDWTGRDSTPGELVTQPAPVQTVPDQQQGQAPPPGPAPGNEQTVGEPPPAPARPAD